MLFSKACSGHGNLVAHGHFTLAYTTLPRTLEAALAQCSLAEASQVAIVRQRVKAAAEAALAAVLTLEAGLSAEQRGGRQVRTDFLGECGASGD